MEATRRRARRDLLQKAGAAASANVGRRRPVVRRAARVAREEGVTLKVHGVEVGVLKQHDKPAKSRKVLQKPAEAVAPKQPSVVVDEASPPPPSKRQQRSAQRLREFQEKKRANSVAAFVASGKDPDTAKALVAQLESRRLERIAQAPMETETGPVEDVPQREAVLSRRQSRCEGQPRGTEGQSCGEAVAPKRVRRSPPEAGCAR